VEPITRTVTVHGSVETAFRVFTERMGTWWPLETHSIAVDQGLEQRAETLRVDARQGGRIEEVLEDGSTRGWGGIDVWEPPSRVVLSWKPNDLPTPPTEVEVRFTAAGNGTRVDLEHRGWERLGEAAERIHPLYSSENGWTMVLGRYANLADELIAEI
jgi:uncharacterized protein YndB with AHSA1/START domain